MPEKIIKIFLEIDKLFGFKEACEFLIKSKAVSNRRDAIEAGRKIKAERK